VVGVLTTKNQTINYQIHTIMENRYFKDVQKIIETEISSKQPSLLYDPIVYSLSQKANRIRSGFTLIGCEMFGGNMENALYPAVGIEIFHNSILMHDDIIDKSPFVAANPLFTQNGTKIRLSCRAMQCLHWQTYLCEKPI